MKNEKLCEYLSDIGILLFDNIDLFFQIYSTNNSKMFNSKQEKFKNSLFLYLKKTSENENHLKEISNHLIEGYYNSHLINKYKYLTNLFNLLRLKFFSHYNYFITRIFLYIIRNAKPSIYFEKLKEKGDILKNKLRKNNSDDMLLRKEKKHEEKKTEEKNKNDEKNENKKIQRKQKKKNNKIKKMNKYKNNWYKNINDEGVVQHGFFVNGNDDLNKYNNIDNYNINFYDIDKIDNDFNYLNDNNFNYNNYDAEINIPNYNNYKYPIFANNSKSSKLPINYYTPMYNHYYQNDNLDDDNPEFIEDIQIPSIHYINNININNNSNIALEQNLKNYDFFENQEKHEKKVKTKILNLQNEKLKNIEKECTFTPKINSPLSQRAIQKYIVDNKFEKLYNDSIMNKIKKEQKMKKSLEEFKFKPDLKQTENYIVLTTFQERLNNSISQKLKKNGNLKKGKANKIKKKEKKNFILNFEKETQEKNETFKNENHYRNNIAEKKKNLEKLGSQINSNNMDIKHTIDIIPKENIDKDKSKEKYKDEKNNEIDLKDKKEEDLKEKNEEVKKDVNENYQFLSIKNILDNNSLLKKDY